MTNRTNRALLAFLLSVFALDPVGSAAAGDLAKASQNPVGDIVSVPIELWHHGEMPGDSSATVLTTKPVYPVNLGELNLIMGNAHR